MLYEVITNLGERCDRTARALACTLLVNGNRRCQARNRIDATAVGASQESASISAERFDKAALAFAKERMERKERKE